MRTDPYATLGVSHSATTDEITRAYRRQLRAYHPDTRSDASNSDADEQLAQILAAYELLRDRRRRAEYDRTVEAVGKDRKDGKDRKGVAAAHITVTHARSVRGEPPLWAGPVRWRPSR